ncbi:hypothetical protein GCM10023075_24960 [Streptosporangium album]|uniref:hypothetical protein n=1 Tax=Streptosporangium album TaxID=47479 RepID=UPI0031E8ABCD
MSAPVIDAGLGRQAVRPRPRAPRLSAAWQRLLSPLAIVAHEQLVADAFNEAKLVPVPVKITDIIDTRFDATVETT